MSEAEQTAKQAEIIAALEQSDSISLPGMEPLRYVQVHRTRTGWAVEAWIQGHDTPWMVRSAATRELAAAYAVKELIR